MALHDGQGERDLLLLWESLHAQIALEKLRCMRARQVLDMHTKANPQTEMPCSTQCFGHITYYSAGLRIHKAIFPPSCKIDCQHAPPRRTKQRYIRIDGSVKTNSRQDLVNNFQNDRDIRAAVLSIHAAGTGLTLTVRRSTPFFLYTYPSF